MPTIGTLLRGWLVVAALAGATAPAAEARTRPPPDVTLSIPSRTMTDTQFLRGEADAGAPVVMSAELRFPNADPKLPVVILLHGSDGPTSGAVMAWRQILDKAGFATLRLDYFTAWGLTDVEADQTQIGFLNAIFDLYRSVDVVAADPRIDPERITVIGFSRGGTAVLYAALSRFNSLYGPQHGRIAAYLPFYAGCSFGLQTEDKLVDAPLRAYHGELDDWVPMAACRDFIDRARALGADATLTVLPGARHAFDNPRAPPNYIVSNAQTARSCRRVERDDEIVNV